MQIVEITVQEFDKFSGLENYFCNGCYFDNNDNLLAFSYYESHGCKASKYFKVVYNEC